MSSDAPKNEKEKNNSINLFSSNFNKFFNKIKYSKNIAEADDKINSCSKSTINNNKTKNKKINRAHNPQLNSLKEYEFIYNESKIPNAKKNINIIENTNLSKTTINKAEDKQTENNLNEPKIKKGNKQLTKKSQSNTFNSPSPMNTILTIKAKYYQNKYKSRQLDKKISKRNNSQNNFENFLQNVKERQKKKEDYINKIRSKSIEKENMEIQKNPKISKNSENLAKSLKREPLYQKKPLNEEKILDKKFECFYTKNYLDNNYNNKNNNKNDNIHIMNNRTLDEKFNKFYESNLRWKKDLEERNIIKRKSKNEEYEQYLGNYSFTPTLNKNSINIIESKNKTSEYNNDINDLYYDEDYYDKEKIERMKIKLKPYINSYYGMNMPYMYRKQMLNKTASDKDIRKNMYHNSNYKMNKTLKNRNYKINYKTDEKMYKKKEEHKNISVNENQKKQKKKLDLNKRGNDYYLLIKIKELHKEKNNKKKELYKLNIRPGTAWNLEAVNNVIPRQRIGHIIEGLL